MDIKQIVEKALKGEDYKTDIVDFSDEQLVEFKNLLTEASDAELEKVTALRKEGKRVEEKKIEKDNATTNQIRTENLSIAKNQFFNDPQFTLTDSEKLLFEEELKRIDSGAIAPELIVKDLKKAFAAVKADDLIAARTKNLEFEKNAAQFNASMAGNDGIVGGADADKYSNDAKTLYKDWQKQGFKGTIEQAQKIIDKGGDWKKSSLAD